MPTLEELNAARWAADVKLREVMARPGYYGSPEHKAARNDKDRTETEYWAAVRGVRKAAGIAMRNEVPID